MFVIFLLIFALILWPEATSFSFWIVVSLVVMAFQGAGQAQQPAPVTAASGYEAVLPVGKIKFDIYPIYDKSFSC